MGKYRKRYKRAKPNELIMSFGLHSGDMDIVVSGGDNISRCDRTFLMTHMTSDRKEVDLTSPLNIAFTHSFVTELEKRGYDITTIQFSIQKELC